MGAMFSLMKPRVHISQGHIFSDNEDNKNTLHFDAIVSPANSFGVMDGGIDEVYRRCFGQQVQTAVQQAILEQFRGELPVSNAFYRAHEPRADSILDMRTHNARFRENVSNTGECLLRIPRCLIAIERFNNLRSGCVEYGRILCPGLGSDIGRTLAGQCAVTNAGRIRQCVKKRCQCPEETI